MIRFFSLPLCTPTAELTETRHEIGKRATVTMPPLDQALSSVSFLVHKMALLVLNWCNRGCH